jgi:hypothetical protein
MNRTAVWGTLLVCVPVFLLQGCSKHLARSDLGRLTPLKVVRHQTPELSKPTAGALLLGVVILGGLGVGAAEALSREKAPADLGELVMKGFVRQAASEVPGWPTMDIQDRPVTANEPFSGNLLEFEVVMFNLHPTVGLQAGTAATMKAADGTVVWKKQFIYQSYNFGRNRSRDEFLANNEQLLTEEIRFAADQTVAALIAHIKGD